jgi:membrane-bound lytic murein transglycosylase D
MGKGLFRALVAMGILVPVVLLGAVLIHPRGRALVGAFFAPLPAEAANDAGSTALPPLATPMGPEAVELKLLREDAAPEGQPERAPIRQPEALFAPMPDGSIRVPTGSFVRPSGLRRVDLTIRDGPTVDRAIHHLTGDVQARERLVDAIRRSGRFHADITRILRAWKVPESLLAVAFVESAFQPTASTGTRMGLWQLPPDVAHVYGLSILPTYDERRGIASGTEAAARHLADLRERFGSWELALVAFDIGYKRTLDELGKHANLDFGEVAPSLPRAATSYVDQVVATALVLANLDRFGLDNVRRDEAASLSDLDVPAGTSLVTVARVASIPMPTLRELNPEYGTDVVPVTTFPMVVHVPSATFARARELLPLAREGVEDPARPDDAGEADASPSPGPQPVISRGTEKRMFYRAQQGDTLQSLSRQFGVPVETIASDNALDATGSLRPGMVLAIRLVEQPASSSPSPAPLPPRSPSRVKK